MRRNTLSLLKDLLGFFVCLFFSPQKTALGQNRNGRLYSAVTATEKIRGLALAYKASQLKSIKLHERDFQLSIPSAHVPKKNERLSSLLARNNLVPLTSNRDGAINASTELFLIHQFSCQQERGQFLLNVTNLK